MPDPEYVVMKLVAPILGFLIANAMFFSGVPGMLRCKRDGSLGDMNPLPFPVVLANCVSWIIYSILIEDYFLFFSNAPGTMVGLYFTLVAYGLSPYKSKMRDALEAWLMSFTFALLALTLYVGIVAMDKSVEHKKTVVGLFANFVLLIYYAAPLTTVKQVIVTRNSRSLYLPLAVANTVNGGGKAYGPGVAPYRPLTPSSSRRARRTARLWKLKLVRLPPTLTRSRNASRVCASVPK
jgi:solute carrier family 50 protein (sugar transporter)